MLRKKYLKYVWWFIILPISAVLISWPAVKIYTNYQLKQETLRVSRALNTKISEHLVADILAVQALYDKTPLQQGYPSQTALLHALDAYFNHTPAAESIQFYSSVTHESIVLLNPYMPHVGHLISKEDCDAVLNHHSERIVHYRAMMIVPVLENLCLYSASHSMMTVMDIKTIIYQLLKEEMAKGYFVILPNADASSLGDQAGAYSIRSHVLGASWNYRIYPSQAFIDAQNKKGLFVMFLILGGLLLLLLFIDIMRRNGLEKSQEGDSSEMGYLRKLAYYDPVTSLPNREYLLLQLTTVLHRAQRHGLNFSLCFIDCDDFKKINDDYGHHVGDQLLKHIADVVSALIRKNDLFARLAGDEFCLILEGTVSNDALDVILTKLLNAIACPVLIGAHILSASVSMGVAIYPEAGLTTEDLLILADRTMYSAKRKKKGTYLIAQK